MKTQLLFVLALVANLFTTNLSANVVENTFDLAGTTVKISTTSKALVVNLGSVQKEVVTISIEDANGVQLMQETVKENPNFVKRYNVAKLENGKYTLTVTKKTIRTVQPFDVTEAGVTIAEIEKKEKFIPYLNFNNDKLDVNVLLGNYSNITVTILDNEGHKVTEDKNYVVMTLHKRYDLSKLAAGAYVVEVLAGDETFYQTIQK